MKTVEIQVKNDGVKGKVITVSNHKGGCGKTALCFSLAANIYEQGHSVLLVDMDQQGSLGKQFNVYGNEAQYKNFTLSRMYMRLKEAEENNIAMNVPLFLCEDKVAIILGDHDLKNAVENAERALDGEERVQELFIEIIEKYRQHFDYIIFDTPPVIEKVKSCIHAFAVSDCVVIPLDELDAVDEVDETVQAIINYSQKSPNIIFAFTQYATDPRGFAHWFDDKCSIEDLPQCIFPVNAKALKRRIGHDERRNTEYRFMLKVFQDNMCKTGIPWNRDIAKCKYVGATEGNREIIDDLCKEIMLKACKGAVENICSVGVWLKKFALLKQYISIERGFVTRNMSIKKSKAVFGSANKPAVQFEKEAAFKRMLLDRKAHNDR
jgi:chromosome partitioning protein